MTILSRAQLQSVFQQGDVPTGTDYSNLIDSCLNLADTGTQTIAGSINPTELVTSRVSAGNANVIGILSAGTVVADNVSFGSAASLNIGTLTATSLSAATIAGNILSIATTISAATLNATTVSADAIYASAMRGANGFYGSVGIVSAAGTTQGAAALLTNVINRGAGVADGTTTGFAIPANRTGLTQYITNGAASANLWPPTGGTINALGANAAFAMAASTLYTIVHVAASAYAVK